MGGAAGREYMGWGGMGAAGVAVETRGDVMDGVDIRTIGNRTNKRTRDQHRD